MRTRLLVAVLAVGAGLAGTVPAVSTAATVTNGGFETGNFTGWTVVNQAGGNGNWFVYTGTRAPVLGSTIAAPPEGTHAATSDQPSRGSHVLFQDVALEAGFTHTLSFVLYYANRATRFATPATLDYTVVPNQQYRVDILKPSAPVTSVAAGDILATVFQTDVGDPLSLAPTRISFGLTAFAGTTVRIRFAEVDNLLYFQGSTDAVAIASSSSKAQCKKGGWRSFGVFKNQGDCVSFIATRGKNPPAGSPSARHPGKPKKKPRQRDRSRR
jgi:hypothetical protein